MILRRCLTASNRVWQSVLTSASAPCKFYTISNTAIEMKRINGGASRILLPTTTQTLNPVRNYAKAKKAKGTGKGEKKIEIDVEEFSQVIDFEKFLANMDNCVESLKQEYISTLSLQTSIGSIDDLMIELEGDKFPLQEIAQIVKKSNNIIISLAEFPQAAAGVKRALVETGMNINPQQDGHKIFIPIPKVTREHREKLSKAAKVLFNDCKQDMRNVENAFVKKATSKETDFSSDLIQRINVAIRHTGKLKSSEAEELLSTKQKDLLGDK